MNAAIYARKSTDDNDKTEDNKSVTRQVERARAYAESKGWTVDDEHVYVDDGISGADFSKRLGLLKMLNALSEFDVIIMSELSRLGREQWQTSTVLSDIAAKKVEVHLYLTKEKLNCESAIDKFLVTAVSFAAEIEREKASQRSRDALLRKAEKGYNTGGSVYGYDNVQVFGENGVKSHTDYRINEEQAEVVRGIFEMYANGCGMTVIAKTLNGVEKYREKRLRYFDGRMPPSPASGTEKGTGSWAPSSVRSILHRERYRGIVPFGKHRNRWLGGAKARELQKEYMRTEREDLVIVPPELAARTAARLKAARESYIHTTDGRLFGRPDSGRESKYLLSGLVRCRVCGHNMIASSVAHGNGRTRRRLKTYECQYHHRRGNTACANNRKPLIEEVDARVVGAIQKQVLTPEAVRYVVEQAAKKIAEALRAQPGEPDKLRADIERLRREIDRFVSAVAAGGGDALAHCIVQHEEKIREMERNLAEFETPVELTDFDGKRTERELRERLKRLSELLADNVPRGRQALRKLLNGPIWMEPHGSARGYVLRGETRLGALLPVTPPMLASPRGFEPLSPP